MRRAFHFVMIAASILITFNLLLSACSVTIDLGSAKTAPTQFTLPTAIDVSAGQAAPQPNQQQPSTGIQVTANVPGGPLSIEGSIEDANSSKHASEKRVLSGDSYRSNFYERPFTATSMDFLPDVDILYGYISTDPQYLYFVIQLAGTNKDTGTMVADYGVELDTDKNGRGDYSIWARNPTDINWTTNNVTILHDANRTVGGKDPNIADDPIFLGDGYETVIPNTGPEQAWVRVSLTDDKIVQIAVPRSIIGNPSEFLWGVWADNGPKNPNLFDYDDHFTYKDAGSPISGNQYYPLKQVAAIDNTCRRPYGFNPGYRIPNMCWSATPVETPTCVCAHWIYFGATKICAAWRCS